MKVMVWLKDDLRLYDNPAVAHAFEKAPPSDVVIARSDEGQISHVRPTARRLLCENEAICEIREVLELHGSVFRAINARPDDIIRCAREHNVKEVHANTQVSDIIGYARDLKVKELLKKHGIRYVEHSDDGVQRGSKPAPSPFITRANEIRGLSFRNTPLAIARLRNFLKRLPSLGYRENMWVPGPDETSTSRLSVEIACGRISGDRIFFETEKVMARTDPRHHLSYHQFVSRIHWRRDFINRFEKSVLSFPWDAIREERPEDYNNMSNWFFGKTGYPLVDASMQQLSQKGWVNFRMRQVVASFALDLLDLDFHKVGIALGELFDDYCPGVHWSQIALQAGMAVNRGPRIVNPVKQARELDPEGKYVRSMLPYLADVPDCYIHEPWMWPGYKGPERIVDHVEAARKARKKYPSSKAA
jgi:deoxyribodipyrimidine photolyase